MPIYDYRCDACGTTYDVFHKVREVEEDVLCPSCGSQQHTRLISAPTVSMKGRASDPLPSCETGGCCSGGSCSLN
jgi:putative FmdB family regulatory protein